MLTLTTLSITLAEKSNLKRVYPVALFTSIDANGKEIVWYDHKRWMWLFGPANIAVPLFSYWLYFQTHNPLTTLIPALYIFGFIPLLDRWIGEDPFNPPEEVVPAMSADPHYRYIVWLMVFMPYISFLAAAFFVGTQDLPWWSILVLAIGVGTGNGNAINIAHELGHKNNRLDRFMAKLALGVSGYGHFCIEHNRGHHVRVSTPEDCSSSRMGESVYAFALRDLPGALIGGWQQEAKRLRARKKPLLHWENEILHVYFLTALIAGLLIFILGWKILPFLLLHHFLGWYALTQVNYIEHYGLLRQKLPNGKYEPCQPRHSWNTNHIVSNLMQIHLQRHSDHHANPQRPYQALRNFDDLPRLPSGYPGCLGLAAFPPLWFKVMDPKLLDWADGDLDKINVCPRARAKLERQYGQGAATNKVTS